MKAFSRCFCVPIIFLLAAAAHSAIFTSAADASGVRLALDCDAEVRKCRMQEIGLKAPSEAIALQFGQRSEYIDFLRGAAEMHASEGNVPNPAVLRGIRWNDCREDRESAGLMAICPVGGWNSGTIALFLRGLCNSCRFAPFVMSTASAGPVSPPEQPEQPWPTATRLLASRPMTPTGALRTDGVFATDEQRTNEGTRYRSFVRFFDGGDALSLSTAASPEVVCKRFVRETPASITTRRGRVEQNGAEVTIAVSSSTGAAAISQGRVDGERLRLENTFDGALVSNVFFFYECPVDAR